MKTKLLKNREKIVFFSSCFRFRERERERERESERARKVGVKNFSLSEQMFLITCVKTVFFCVQNPIFSGKIFYLVYTLVLMRSVVFFVPKIYPKFCGFFKVALDFLSDL